MCKYIVIGYDSNILNIVVTISVKCNIIFYMAISTAESKAEKNYENAE